MSIWFFLWLLLSLCLLYFLGWTLYILFRQKQAWQAYAKQKNLRYKSTKFFTSPEITGTVDGYTLHMLTGEHISKDGRTRRKLTAIEINLFSRLPMEVIMASAGMVEVAQALSLKEEYRPDDPAWHKDYIAVTSSVPALRAYLKPGRLESLMSLMKVPNAWIIVVFRGDAAFLRLDTPAALENSGKISLLIERMIQTARILELEPGEESILKTESARIVREKIPAAVTPASQVGSIDLQLEEESDAPALEKDDEPLAGTSIPE